MQSIGQSGFVLQTSAWSHIPAELRARPQWCLSLPTGPDKRPLTADGRPASITDPRTWTDFESACRSAAANGCVIGYVQTADDPFTCIDMDVKDGTPREVLDRFQTIIERFDSYTERSRSGRGFHVWVRGKIGDGRRRDGVEVYSQVRFMICTGDVVRDKPVAERQAMLDNMISRMEPPAPEIPLTGDDVPDMALAARATADPNELGRLFRGEWEGRYPSQSEADLALATLLLSLTNSLRECWATFRLSALGKREKAGRADYMRRTLGLAAQRVANDAESVRHGQEVAASLMGQAADSRSLLPFRLLIDGDLDSLPRLRWLVKPIVPDAGIGAIYGDSGTFKSFLTLDLLAHVSNGREWFGNRTKAAPTVYVPFEGQGGIPNRVKAWRLAQTMERNPDLLMALVPDADVRSNVAVVMEPLNLQEAVDRDRLVTTLTESGWAGGVLCIDTLAHASNGIEENSSAMGEMIGIFRDLQHRLGGVILLVHHSGKDQSRGMRGWSGLHAAMDFVIECQKEGEGDTREAQFRLSKVKDGTTGTVFKFRMQMVPLGCDEDGDPITSLVVCPKEAKENDGSPPFKVDVDEAQQAADDAAFVEAWIREIAIAGKRPTGRGLEAKRASVNGRRVLTQKRLRDAIESLKEDGRLALEQGGPSGAKWLRPIDVPLGAA